MTISCSLGTASTQQGGPIGSYPVADARPTRQPRLVQREIHEETGLDVSVQRLLLDEDIPPGVYRRYRTYLCQVLKGDARPGCEPEADAA